MRNYGEGTFGGGFVWGFLFGIFALIPILIMGKPETKKGATVGFLTWVVVLIIVRLVS